MTSSPLIERLAERCEQATGPTRGLDNAIRLATNGRSAFGDDPAYTASLDAAMMLVPEGWRWAVDNDAREGGCAYVWQVVELEHEGRAATPALALCAAALRAKATSND